jgi:hypothetical protein
MAEKRSWLKIRAEYDTGTVNLSLAGDTASRYDPGAQPYRGRILRKITKKPDFSRVGEGVPIFQGTHPSVAQRIEFADTYKPWEQGNPLVYGNVCKPE